MKARETVMKTYHFNLDGITSEIPVKEITIKIPEFLAEQAEITGKIMLEQGRREVVELIVDDTNNFELPLSLGCIAKLKEWRVNDQDRNNTN